MYATCLRYILFVAGCIHLRPQRLRLNGRCPPSSSVLGRGRSFRAQQRQNVAQLRQIPMFPFADTSNEEDIPRKKERLPSLSHHLAHTAIGEMSDSFFDLQRSLNAKKEHACLYVARILVSSAGHQKSRGGGVLSRRSVFPTVFLFSSSTAVAKLY